MNVLPLFSAEPAPVSITLFLFALETVFAAFGAREIVLTKIFLFAYRPDELAPAISAGDGLIAHSDLPLHVISRVFFPN